MLSTAKHLVSLVLVFLVAICLFAVSSGAQKSKNKSGKVSVTGCLQKGDEPDEFSITGEDGKLYGLRSSSVKLGEHLGHKVTVNGQLKPESQEEANEGKEAKEHKEANEGKEAKEHKEANEGKETGKKEAGDIQVSSLKMVSGSCQ